MSALAHPPPGPEPCWQVVLTPARPLRLNVLLLLLLACGLGGVVGVMGLAGLLSGAGMAFGNHGRGVSVGGVENLLAAGAFFLLGFGGAAGALYWHFWNSRVVETVTLSTTTLTVARRALRREVRASFPREHIRDVRARVNDRNPSAIALGFLDFSTCPTGNSYVAFTCEVAEAGFGLDLTAGQAEDLAEQLRQALRAPLSAR